MKAKQIFCAAVSFMICCYSLLPIPIQAAENEKVYENITYTEGIKGITVTGCAEDTETLVIPETIEGKPVTAIESRAFVNRPELKTVTLPDKLIELGDRAFTDCTALETVHLPETLTAVKHNTFNGCSSLKSIVIPDTVQTIGTGAFRNCTELADITFPKQLDAINKSAFTDTAWLAHQPEGFVYISNVLYCYKGDMPQNTELTLDESITVIADGALSNQRNLTAVTFHDRIKSIGWDAFRFTGIVSADIPPVTELKLDTFSDCIDLKRVTIPGTVEVIDSSVFAGCINLESVTLQDGVQSIGTQAFLDCHALKSITLPASVKMLQSCAFGFQSQMPGQEGYDDIQMLKESEDFTIYGYPYTAAEVYAAEYGFPFSEPADAPAPVPGDVNCDGSFRISDIVLFQKWLVNTPGIELKKPETADWNADGKLNAIDLSLMKLAMMGRLSQEPEINIKWETSKKTEKEVCRYLQDSIRQRLSGIDVSQLTFEWVESVHDIRNSSNPDGDTVIFRLSYQGIPLDYSKYAVKVHLCNHERYELDAVFLTADFVEKLAAIDTSEVISKQAAIETARAYAAEMKLPTETGTYQPSDRFGEETFLVYYSVEDACLAYQAPDPGANIYSVNALLYSVRANVFVDAKTGEVLENRYDERMSVA